jgi:hypothetical protein
MEQAKERDDVPSVDGTSLLRCTSAVVPVADVGGRRAISILASC